MKELIDAHKQETLEEAAEQFEYTNGIYGFKQGAKWQAERMYSDMQEYARFCIECDRKELPLLLVEEWFKQFKNEKQ